MWWGVVFEGVGVAGVWGFEGVGFGRCGLWKAWGRWEGAGVLGGEVRGGVTHAHAHTHTRTCSKAPKILDIFSLGIPTPVSVTDTYTCRRGAGGGEGRKGLQRWFPQRAGQ